jgi:hypothetical protein
MRDLVRLRAGGIRDVTRSRQQLQGFLLRHDPVYAGKKCWTLAYIVRRSLVSIPICSDERIRMVPSEFVPVTG